MEEKNNQKEELEKEIEKLKEQVEIENLKKQKISNTHFLFLYTYSLQVSQS